MNGACPGPSAHPEAPPLRASNSILGNVLTVLSSQTPGFPDWSGWGGDSEAVFPSASDVFSRSLYGYLLSTYDVPGAVLAPGDLGSRELIILEFVNTFQSSL